MCVCVRSRYDGVHRLLLQFGPHCHLPVQTAVALYKEASHAHGDGRPLPAHHAAAPRDDPAGQRSALVLNSPLTLPLLRNQSPSISSNTATKAGRVIRTVESCSSLCGVGVRSDT